MTCMKAGTNTIRTRVASARTASVSPRPNIRITEVLAAINAANEIDMISAAAVITRPVWAIPSATASSLDMPGLSQNSRMRATRNTS